MALARNVLCILVASLALVAARPIDVDQVEEHYSNRGLLQTNGGAWGNGASDYLMLVHTWPAALCNAATGFTCQITPSGCPTYPTTRFSIHGMWPQYGTGYPQNCCAGGAASCYSQCSSASLNQQLMVSWPDYKVPNSYQFWDHEWSKHGTCMGLSQTAYFQKSLQLRSAVDLYQNLANAGILPSTTATPSKTAVINAVSVGGAAVVTCNKSPSGVWQLFEIYVCYDALTATTTPYRIPCPSNLFPKSGASNFCPTTFKYITFASATKKSTLTSCPCACTGCSGCTGC